VVKGRGVLKIAIAFVMGCSLSALVVGRELHPTYYESNDLLNTMWRSKPLGNFKSPSQFSFEDIVGPEFVHICHFSASGGNILDYVKTQHSLVVKTFVKGVLIEDWDTEHLFKILLLAPNGNAIIWNFDERLFEVRRHDETNNCFATKDLSIEVISKSIPDGNQITQISLVKKLQLK
jgi:hypothetical protein